MGCDHWLLASGPVTHPKALGSSLATRQEVDMLMWPSVLPGRL